MHFVEFTTPEGKVSIDRKAVAAVYESESNISAVRCKIQLNATDTAFNVIESYKVVMKKLWNL